MYLWNQNLFFAELDSIMKKHRPISLYQNTSVTEQQFCGLDSNILDWSPGHLSLQEILIPL